MVLGEGKWVKLDQQGDWPGARSSHAIAVVGQKVYAFGGEFTPRVPVDNHLYVFDLNNQTWSVADATGDVPPPRVGPPHRSYHSMTTDDRRVYVFGGCGNAGRLNDMWAYDVVDKYWIKFPMAGENCKPRGGPGLTAVLGKIWVVYGFSGVELDDVHYFDPNEGKWVQVETSGDKPTARSVFSTVGVGKYVFIYGGEIDPSDLGHLGAGKFSGEVYTLDTETLVWKRWEDGKGSDYHPGPRGWCAFAGGQRDGQVGLLVYGGNSPSNDRLNDIFFFTPWLNANGK
ncbi:hypothetical protein Pfo_022205 [Paulownia fortunei]|nr:hypothetical protein Pfo_022205 [Paulownia fortunei]